MSNPGTNPLGGVDCTGFLELLVISPPGVVRAMEPMRPQDFGHQAPASVTQSLETLSKDGTRAPLFQALQAGGPARSRRGRLDSVRSRRDVNGTILRCRA